MAAAPVIVLTYNYAGVRRLRALLEREPALACTTSTGILAAVSHAAQAWRQAEDRPDEPMTPLAAASVRALVTGMLTVIRARTGSPRWCEISSADPAAVASFLKILPATRVVCLHRACLGTIRAVLDAHPWGIYGPEFAQYVAAYPGSTSAALAAWWAASAGPVLDFEAEHPHECLRVRHEDLLAEPESVIATIRDFLKLPGPPPAADPLESRGITPDPEEPKADYPFPFGQLPPPLAQQVSALHARLGYPPLDAQPDRAQGDTPTP